MEGGAWVIRCPLPLIVCASVQINNLWTQINRGIHHESVPKTVTDFCARLLREQDTWHWHFYCEKWQLPVCTWVTPALDGWAGKCVVSTGILFIISLNVTLCWLTTWLDVSLKKLCHFRIESIDLGLNIEIVTKRLMLFECVCVLESQLLRCSECSLAHGLLCIWKCSEMLLVCSGCWYRLQ